MNHLTKHHSVFALAQVEIVSTAKNLCLMPKHDLVIEQQLKNFPYEPASGMQREAKFLAQLQATIVRAASKHLVDLMRKDVAIKRRIGGVKWHVQLCTLPIEVPLFYEAKDAKWDTLTREFNRQKVDLLELMGAIIGRNKAIITNIGNALGNQTLQNKELDTRDSFLRATGLGVGVRKEMFEPHRT